MTRAAFARLALFVLPASFALACGGAKAPAAGPTAAASCDCPGDGQKGPAKELAVDDVAKLNLAALLEQHGVKRVRSL